MGFSSLYSCCGAFKGALKSRWSEQLLLLLVVLSFPRGALCAEEEQKLSSISFHSKCLFSVLQILHFCARLAPPYLLLLFCFMSRLSLYSHSSSLNASPFSILGKEGKRPLCFAPWAPSRSLNPPFTYSSSFYGEEDKRRCESPKGPPWSSWNVQKKCKREYDTFSFFSSP